MISSEFTGGPALADRLALEQVAPDLFRGHCGIGPAGNVFGGQLAGQALFAAALTVDTERPVRSLHAYFLRPPRPGATMDYCVERVRDGRTAAVRTVTAVQDGRPALTMTASFQTTDAVAHSQLEMPPVVDAELAPVGMRGPVEVRPVVWSGRSGEAAPRQLIWMRCPTELPDDPRAHAAAVTFASDLTLGWSPWKALGVHRVVEPMFGASIDHAMWFHAPVRFDDWLLVDQGSQAVAGDRGLAVASVYDRSGRMVMTTAQEGLMRGIAAAALNARDLLAADVEGDCDDDVFRIA